MSGAAKEITARKGILDGLMYTAKTDNSSNPLTIYPKEKAIYLKNRFKPNNPNNQ
jgi:hypothetical protein